MKIAVEGCAHGELEKIYETLQAIERDNNIKIDLLLCCGDFQSVRNKTDLTCMAVPQKYQSMCTFYKYYSGEAMAPILTIFIGGNHEASNYLGELAYGGWVCPNIYYLGYAGVLRFGDIRIAGISGIFKGHDFLRGHFEKPPYDNQSKRSAYHIRCIDIYRLKQIRGSVDVFMSHDWPRGIYHYGDLSDLLRRKPFLREDVNRERLGSGPTWDLLEKLRPDFWFAAHLHVKFSALVTHPQDQSESDRDREKNPTKVTKFLALDKCLPRRDFLQEIRMKSTLCNDVEVSFYRDAFDLQNATFCKVLDIGSENNDDVADKSLFYDPEWLSILRSTNHLLSVSKNFQYLPNSSGSKERCDFRPTEEEFSEVRRIFNNDFRIPDNFQRTAEAYDPKDNKSHGYRQPKLEINPQTQEFCLKLGIDDPFQLLLDQMCQSTSSLTIHSFNSDASANKSFNPDEVVLDDDDDDDDDDGLDKEDSKFSDMPSTDVSIISTSADVLDESSTSIVNATPRSKLRLPPILTPQCPPHLMVTSTPLRRVDLIPSINSISDKNDNNGDVSNDGQERVRVDPDLKCIDVTPPIKKFKRRNCAIYASNDNDNDLPDDPI